MAPLGLNCEIARLKSNRMSEESVENITKSDINYTNSFWSTFIARHES